MIRKFRNVINYLLERDVAGRAVPVLPDDIFLGYPKSGKTWTRFLLGNLMNPDEGITFANVERKVPDIYAGSKRTFKKAPRPRLIRSHECFDLVGRVHIPAEQIAKAVELSSAKNMRKTETAQTNQWVSTKG